MKALTIEDVFLKCSALSFATGCSLALIGSLLNRYQVAYNGFQCMLVTALIFMGAMFFRGIYMLVKEF